jgi:hypothetical protein
MNNSKVEVTEIHTLKKNIYNVRSQLKELGSEGHVLVPLLSTIRPVFDRTVAASCTHSHTCLPNDSREF